MYDDDDDEKLELMFLCADAAVGKGKFSQLPPSFLFLRHEIVYFYRVY